MTHTGPSSVRLDVEGSRDVLPVALVIPLRGPAGIFGPSAELCALLAAEELNATAGVLGRELRLVVVDGGREPQRVADEVGALVAGGVEAVVGWHLSAVRQAVAPRVAGHVPYVYSGLYEGGETRPGVFLTGETPDSQLRPAFVWLREALGVRRWALVGNDDMWPRWTARRARRFLVAQSDARLADEVFVRLGTHDFGVALSRVERSRCEAVLMLLVGQDAVHFNRQFAARRLDERCLRLSPLMEENMLLGSGVRATSGLYSTAGFFETLTTASSLDFTGRFTRRFGVHAPVLNNAGESCYEAVRLLAELFVRAGTTELGAVCGAAENVGYTGPRGEVRLQGNHLQQQVYLARAAGLEFEVLAAI